MNLAQLQDGYRYNSDTLFLYDFICKDRIFGDVLDLGCGCGILGFLVKRDFENINLTGIDIQEINCKIAEFNANQNKITSKIICDDVVNFSKQGLKFDFIISNPPFYSPDVKQSKNTHKQLSRYSSWLNFNELALCVNKLIKPGGIFYFCYDFRRIMEVLSGLSKYKLTLIKLRPVYAKYNINAKIALFAAKKGSKSQCEILPALFANDGLKTSDEARMIFQKANTMSSIYE